MIVGTIHNTEDSAFLLKMNKVLRFLQNTDLEGLPVGQIVLEPDSIIVYVQEYTTSPASELLFETHQKFIDMQVMVSGEEMIAYAPKADLKPKGAYDSAKDIAFFEEPEKVTTISMHPGDYAVMKPEDGHKPRCILSQACKVKKIVVKMHV